MTEAKLDHFEQDIENTAESFVPLVGKDLKRIEATIVAAKKSKSINIRMTEQDLERVKARSRQEGLPYQTLISSIIHRYLNGTLVDEAAIKQSLRLLSS